MDPRHHPFGVVDERLFEGDCVHCGCDFVDADELEHLRINGPKYQFDSALDRKRTRDHVPSLAFLDQPFPPNIPVVDCCRKCNTRFSLDEQYLACLLECVVSGGTEPELFSRTRVARTLRKQNALRERITTARRNLVTGLAWEMEVRRVRQVVMKLARGHVALEEYPRLPEPISVAISPLVLMSSDMRFRFERSEYDSPLFPEVGSRALGRIALDVSGSNWIDVQPGRYRYAFAAHGDGISVRLVIRDYLACEVSWV
jgi:hypothetical protein